MPKSHEPHAKRDTARIKTGEQRIRSLKSRKKKYQSFQPDFHDLERRLMPATFLVNTTADSDVGSLRQAIIDSNATPGLNTIDFNIGSVGSEQTIVASSGMPNITNPVLVDGWSQGGPGYAGVPLVQIDGTNAGTGARGLSFGVGSDGSTVQAMVVSGFSGGFSGAAIALESNDNLVQGCYIGTNDTGMTALANETGVLIDASASFNTIGGPTAAAINVISGNRYGVDISSADATANLIEGNRIGSNAAGTAALGNNYGVRIEPSPDNTIGGTAAGAGNLISGNNYGGILVSGSTATGNLIEGNQFGVNAAGTTLLNSAEFGAGVQVSSFGNTIGGTAPGAANLIADGLELGNAEGVENPQGEGNLVEGNFIGTDATGNVAIPGSGGIVIDGTSNTIGGTISGAGNIIAGYTYYGITIEQLESTDNLIEGNRIGTNADGTVALGGNCGVAIVSGATDNTIGGTAPGAGNLISGNTVARGYYPNPAGVEIVGDTTSGNLVEGNLIGTSFDGTAAVPNGAWSSSGSFGGVVISGGANNNTIGGTAAGTRNVISGNVGAGVSIDIDQGDGTADNVVEGNVIGTNAAGTAALPNSVGVELRVAGQSNRRHSCWRVEPGLGKYVRWCLHLRCQCHGELD